MKTYIIAEAGVNHNGSLARAKTMIAAAAEAGANAVKFQTFRAKDIVGSNARKAIYQEKNTNSEETQFEMLRNLELDETAHGILIDYAKEKKIDFMSSPFDLKSAALLIQKYDIPRLKIASGEITNIPLLVSIASSGKPVILSTGMSLMGEIEIALGALAYGYLHSDAPPGLSSFLSSYSSSEGQSLLAQKVSLLHCTSEYPAPLEDVNLKCVKSLRRVFQLPVGYSDHTEGIEISLAAVTLGACIIEKHFTLDKLLPGPDHKASLEPDELKQMVRGIRKIEIAMGSGIKRVAESEIKNREIVRKSLVASRPIAMGELFTEHNLSVKRPAGGLEPIHYWASMGRVANRGYEVDAQIDKQD